MDMKRATNTATILTVDEDVASKYVPCQLAMARGA